jgi:hypothetical protein
MTCPLEEANMKTICPFALVSLALAFALATA